MDDSAQVDRKGGLMQQEKLIAGVPHTLKRCSCCKHLVWREKKHSRQGFVCTTCLESNLNPSTRGGTRVIRDARGL